MEEDGNIHRHQYRLTIRSLVLDMLKAFRRIGNWHKRMHGWRLAFGALDG